ncbi:MAG: methyltransferase domain-containing protein [Candidatus Bathyarchaeota archaeon]|nr:methyltransferase domain-containing protein [Candidatus Bathyarchaeota archaeon]
MDVNAIDWNSVWREGAIFMVGHADKASLWDSNAARWNRIQNESDYGKKVMERLKLRPDWTALDVGAGAGMLAIPMAKACKHVTALDGSSEMLNHLAQNAKESGVSNITCINKLIEQTEIGVDIEPHDIVIACRSMGLEKDVQTFLKKMDEATKRYAYLVWGASKRIFDIGIHNAMGRPYGETRTYLALCNVLYQMGISPNVEIFQVQPSNTMLYRSVDEAVSEIKNRFARRNDGKELTPAEQTKLHAYLEKTLKQTSTGDYKFEDKTPSLQALIWWEKSLPRH